MQAIQLVAIGCKQAPTYRVNLILKANWKEPALGSGEARAEAPCYEKKTQNVFVAERRKLRGVV